MGIPGSSIPRDNRLRGWPCSTWSWALFVFIFYFFFCWFFGTPADGCRHGHINPASCLDWWRCGCRSLLAVAAALATSHLPKLEYPVKRNENRSNQAENTHTCCPRRGGGGRELARGAALSHWYANECHHLKWNNRLKRRQHSGCPSRRPNPNHNSNFNPNPILPDFDSDPDNIYALIAFLGSRRNRENNLAFYELF